MPLQHGRQNVSNLDPTDVTSQERGHRDLVGSVEPGGSGSSDAPGFVGEPEAAERVDVGRLEVEAPQRRPVDAPERGADPLWIGQGVPDR